MEEYTIQQEYSNAIRVAILSLGIYNGGKGETK